MQLEAGGLEELLLAYPQFRVPIIAAVQHTHGQSAVSSISKAKSPQAEQSPSAQDSASTSADANAALPAESSDRRKVAGFEQLARSSVRERYAPEQIRLPSGVVDALDTAWRDSNPKDAQQLEQGGRLIRTYGGKYKINRDKPGNNDSFEAHFDVGVGDTLVGIMHTHPFLEEGFDYGSFSDIDLASIVDEDQQLNILRSGTQTYMIARTREFDRLVARHEKADTLGELKAAMMLTYREAFKKEAELGLGHPAQIEAGVRAVCRKYRLLYYWGQGSDLRRVR